MFDAIIVLGGGYGAKDWKSRVDKAIESFRKKEAPKIIMSGEFDMFHKGEETEAEKMKKYAVSKGIPKKAILNEEESRDTIGNALFTRRRFLEPNKWSKIIVVTSDYHMPRAKLIFKQIMGKKSKMKFLKSKYKLQLQDKEEAENHERRLLAFTKTFARLRGVGELAALEELLFKHHPLYRKEKDL